MPGLIWASAGSIRAADFHSFMITPSKIRVRKSEKNAPLPPALVYVIIEQRFLKTAPFSNLTQLAHDEAGRSGWYCVPIQLLCTDYCLCRAL